MDIPQRLTAALAGAALAAAALWAGGELLVQAGAAPPVPHWQLMNADGFGQAANTSVAALEIFQGDLWAGTVGLTQTELWRSSDGLAWTGAVTAGAEPYLGAALLDLQTWEGQLFASTLYRAQGGALWRSPDGITWTDVISRAAAGSRYFPLLTVYSQTLFALADTGVLTEPRYEVWQSAAGGLWNTTPLTNLLPYTLAVFDGALFLGGRQSAAGAAALWRTDGQTWEPLPVTALWPSATLCALAEYQGWLYALLLDTDAQGTAAGLEMWRSTDGLAWEPAAAPDLARVFAGAGTLQRATLFVYDAELFLFTYDLSAGGDVWRSPDGAAWDQVGSDGWGSPATRGPTAASLAVFQDSLWAGPLQMPTAPSELWRFLPHAVWLPALHR